MIVSMGKGFHCNKGISSASPIVVLTQGLAADSNQVIDSWLALRLSDPSVQLFGNQLCVNHFKPSR